MEIFVKLIDNMLSFFLYMCVAMTFLHLPEIPIIMNLAAMGIHPSWLIALIGGLGSCVGALLDYIIVAELRNVKRVDELLRHRYYKAIEYYFTKVAFLSLVLSGFLVFIPFYPFRVLAATAGYSKYRYILAIFIGRAPRYYLIALLGEQIQVHPAVLGTVFLVLVAAPFLRYLYRKLRGKTGRKAVELPS